MPPARIPVVKVGRSMHATCHLSARILSDDPRTSMPKVTVKKISKPVSTLILVLPGSTVTSSKQSSTEERRMRNSMQYSNNVQYTTCKGK